MRRQEMYMKYNNIIYQFVQYYYSVPCDKKFDKDFSIEKMNIKKYHEYYQ
jgi:hypothetical protein